MLTLILRLNYNNYKSWDQGGRYPYTQIINLI